MFSQRRELSRVRWWLRSTRFDDTELRPYANGILKMLEDGTYEKDTEWTREPRMDDERWDDGSAQVRGEDK